MIIQKYICAMTIAEAFSWAVGSAVKILFTPIIMAGTGQYTYWEVLITTSVGGVLGAILFYFLGSQIFNLFEKLFSKKNKKKKLFTKKNRRIVGVKMKFGLVGLAAFMGIISVPIGAFIVSLYFKNPYKALPALIISAIAWCTVLTSGTFLISSLF